MSHRRTTTGVRTGFVLAVVTLAVVAGVVGVAGMAAGSTAHDAPITEHRADDAPNATATIAPEVAAADGETSVVVRFESDPVDPTVEDDVAVRRLKRQAERSQRPLRTFADDRVGVTVERSLWISNSALLTVDTDVVSLDRIAAIDGVESLEPNARVTVDRPKPSDPSTTSTDNVTYGLDQINATEAWEEYGTRGENTTVAILDSGVDPDHPDVEVDGWKDFGKDADEPKDYDEWDGHGTHVSGTATGGNASGTAIGVAPEAELIHGAVLTDCSPSQCSTEFPGGVFDVEEGIQWAVANDADVVSMSLGSTDSNLETLIDPIQNARASGTVVVTSVGNSGEGTSSSPGNFYDEVSVGAVNENGNVTGFSGGETINTSAEYGDDAPDDWPEQYVVPDVTAPGKSVKSAGPDGGYKRLSGTSMAAPHVAGAVALLDSATGNALDPETLESYLEETANGPDEQGIRYGHGIIDVEAAIDEATSDRPLTATIEGTNDPIAGENLTVDVRVTNVGDTDRTTDLNVSVDDLGTKTRTVALAPGESTTETVTFSTAFEDEGNYTAVAEIDTMSDQTDVTLRDPTFFEVENASVDPKTVLSGTPVDVEATVTNTRLATETQSLSLLAGKDTYYDDPEEIGTKNVTLAGNETTTVTFESVNTSGFPGADRDVVVESDDGRAATTLTVEPAFNVTSITPRNFTAEQGDTITVSATITNQADEGQTQTVRHAIWQRGDRPPFDPGVVPPRTASLEATNLTLSANETATVEFEVDTTWLPSGPYLNHGVITDSDTLGGPAAIRPGPNVTVDGIEPRSTNVTQGDRIDVTATINNTDNETVTTGVLLGVINQTIPPKPQTGPEFPEPGPTEALLERTTEVTIGPNGTETVTFENVSTKGLPPGSYPHVVQVPGDSMNGRLNVSAARTIDPGTAEYAGENGVVKTGGLVTAIDDWTDGEADLGLLRDVVYLWRTGEQAPEPVEKQDTTASAFGSVAQGPSSALLG